MLTTEPAVPTKPQDWRHAAACLDEDPDLFFPLGSVGPLVAVQEAAAKAVCAGCPVVAACLNRALETGEAGVWGGTNDRERVALRRRRHQRERRAARVAERRSA